MDPPRRAHAGSLIPAAVGELALAPMGEVGPAGYGGPEGGGGQPQCAGDLGAFAFRAEKTLICVSGRWRLKMSAKLPALLEAVFGTQTLCGTHFESGLQSEYAVGDSLSD